MGLQKSNGISHIILVSSNLALFIPVSVILVLNFYTQVLMSSLNKCSFSDSFSCVNHLPFLIRLIVRAFCTLWKMTHQRPLCQPVPQHARKVLILLNIMLSIGFLYYININFYIFYEYILFIFDITVNIRGFPSTPSLSLSFYYEQLLDFVSYCTY